MTAKDSLLSFEQSLLLCTLLLFIYSTTVVGQISSAGSVLSSARALVQAGKVDSALMKLNQFLTTNPQHEEALGFRAVLISDFLR